MGSALIWVLPAMGLIAQCSPLSPFCFRQRKHRVILSTLHFFIFSAITHNAYSASNVLQPSLRQTAKGYSSRPSWRSIFSATFSEPQVELFSPFFVTHVNLVEHASSILQCTYMFMSLWKTLLVMIPISTLIFCSISPFSRLLCRYIGFWMPIKFR